MSAAACVSVGGCILSSWLSCSLPRTHMALNTTTLYNSTFSQFFIWCLDVFLITYCYFVTCFEDSNLYLNSGVINQGDATLITHFPFRHHDGSCPRDAPASSMTHFVFSFSILNTSSGISCNYCLYISMTTTASHDKRGRAGGACSLKLWRRSSLDGE